MRRFVSAGTLASCSGTRVASSPGSRFSSSGTFGMDKSERSGADSVHVPNGRRSRACATSQRETTAITAMPLT
jgi:hypothetical protein